MEKEKNPAKNIRKNRILADTLLIVGLVLLSLALILPMKNCEKQGNYAVLTVNGEKIGEYPLDTDFQKEIKTEYGTNVLKIENGEAKIVEADCKDKICVAHFAVSKEGESIICLPHKLVVKIVCK